MLRDNLVGLIEPMPISAGVDPLALSIQKQASDDRSSCLENPRPEGAESSLTENVASPFQAEPAQNEVLHAPENSQTWNRTPLCLTEPRWTFTPHNSQTFRKPYTFLVCRKTGTLPQIRQCHAGTLIYGTVFGFAIAV